MMEEFLQSLPLIIYTMERLEEKQRELVQIQNIMVYAWMTSETIVVESQIVDDSLCFEHLVRNGEETFMLEFDHTIALWDGVEYVHPMKMDWMKFDAFDKKDLEYLVFVIKVLEEQYEMWRWDVITAAHPCFHHFERFLQCLNEMYEYLVKVQFI